MEKIRFLNYSTVYEGDVFVQGNVVSIRFNEIIPPQNILSNGFELLNENNGLVQGNYSGYTTIYRMHENNEMLIEFSNDGSIYIPPVIPDPEPEPEPYIPTYEEVLNNKIIELSSICQNAIVAGLEINGQHFSYNNEDQTNLKEIFDTVKITGLPMGYHADGQGCTEYTAEELINMYIQLTMNKYCQQTYFNQTREYLESLENNAENKEMILTYKYGTPLIDPYLTKYNHMIALYEAQINALIPESKSNK